MSESLRKDEEYTWDQAKDTEYIIGDFLQYGNVAIEIEFPEEKDNEQ